VDVARPGGPASLCAVRGKLLADSAPHAGTAWRMRIGLDRSGPVLGSVTWRVAGLAICLATALALSVRWVRELSFGYLFAAVPLVWLVVKAAQRLSCRSKAAFRVVAIGLLAPGLMLALPGAVLSTSTIKRGDNDQSACDVGKAAAALTAPTGLGARARLIAAPVDNGPELLFRTPHRVLAAPYQRNASGNLDAYDFFAARDATEAHRIAARRDIDLVFFCPGDIGMWLPAHPGSRHFVDQLSVGQVPSWLRPLPLPVESHALLYQVVEPRSGPVADVSHVRHDN